MNIDWRKLLNRKYVQLAEELEKQDACLHNWERAPGGNLKTCKLCGKCETISATEEAKK